MYDFLPLPNAPPVNNMLRDLTWRQREPGAQKIAFRAHLLASVNTGNHWVSQPVQLADQQMTIRHYPFLGFDHFVEKAHRGALVLSLTDLPANIGEHWREWGHVSDDDLRRVWECLLDRNVVEDPLAEP